ncbi:hypothetical protein FB451DRAFT_1188202 [Mycena latifolia]|nr:hypothetical protein FB451DRAFT_1188202 [Mycena latifolia]
MSTQTRPDSGMAAFTAPRRISMACVKCRAGKVKCISPEDGRPCARCTKRRLECEYLPVPDEQARSGSTTGPRRRSRKQPPPPSAPTPHLPSGSIQAPRGYGGSGRGSPPYPVQGYFPPQSSSQFNPGTVGPTPMIEPNRYPPQPQHHVAGDYIPYNNAATVNQLPLGHPPSRLPNQQPGAPGYPSEYQQYLANFGRNDISHPAAMFPRRCTCVPGEKQKETDKSYEYKTHPEIEAMNNTLEFFFLVTAAIRMDG